MQPNTTSASPNKTIIANRPPNLNLTQSRLKKGEVTSSPQSQSSNLQSKAILHQPKMMESRPMNLINHSASQPGFAIAPVIISGTEKNKQKLE